jgi:ribosomal protein L37E
MNPTPVIRPGAEERRHTCERCGERMTESHCKIVCGNCGYSRDCSDP